VGSAGEGTTSLREAAWDDCTRAAASTKEAYRQAGHRWCVPGATCSPIAS
jgi:hypothetical protein